MMIEEMPRLISKYGLQMWQETLLGLVAEGFRVEPTLDDEARIAIGDSKLGGRPDLPEGVEWPVWNGTPLAFLCQIKLSDVADLPVADVLPKEGVLSFFYHAGQTTWGFDPEDRGSWRVLFLEGAAARLSRREYPVDLPEEGRFEASGMSFRRTVTLPPLEDEDIEGLELAWEQRDAYLELLEELRGQPCHQLLGHPAQIQGDMRLECQLVTHGLYCGDGSGYEHPRRTDLEPGAREWRLLLQLDSDEGAGMMWGDCGRLYFWIHQQDLRARDFEHVWMILQCY